ncbi:hypothetical protein K7H09_16830 [Halomonas sp. IOP_14]|uniref:hypothetical protein n=1 Tax=Halomonas sp. IOP_14 TaxID=2873295 RepID=UPI001E2B3E12|nr:hypothetical protein [Halomonas sp. IOP_14]MCD1587671.1 hypothetical protein [Halomonas sp. IOP_14]
MLFRLAPNTPRFEVFNLLNEELLHFLEQSVSTNTFSRALFTQGAVGQACWTNSPTREKSERLFNALQAAGNDTKRQLFQAVLDNQNLEAFFWAPQRDLFDFMNETCQVTLKSLCTHLYCSTKDLAPVVRASGGTNITDHFNAYSSPAVNGKICKACGMKELAAFRAGIPEGDQWRADYDHQLCKSKYPIFSVHPDNLVPLCDVCNQDAKKAKDLFRHKNGTNRLAFYPYNEEAKGLIVIEIENLRDPEPRIKIKWNTQNDALLDKLNTWNEIYEIRSRVEGQFRSLEAIIEDEICPRDSIHLASRISDEARPNSINTLKRKEWAFWFQKLFSTLDQVDISPFVAKWNFVQQQAADGGEYILFE